MRKPRNIVFIALGACAALCAGALCACTEDPQPPPHTEHVYGEWQIVKSPDCTNDGERVHYCACGEEEREPVPALGHDLTHYEGKTPSCEEGGWKEYDVCSRGDYNSYEALSATGHSFSDEWSYDESAHWHAATCGHNLKEDEALHAFNAENVCAECGYERPRELLFTLSGNGEYYSVSKGEATGDIVIPDEYNGIPVTVIPDGAFLNGSDITSVRLGANIVSIGESAFEGCSAISSLTVPDSVVQIGRRAFYLCTSLQSISLPYVGQAPDSEINTHFGWIFGARTASVNGDVVPQSLESVTVRGATSIAMNAFIDCAHILHIDLNEEIETIGSGAFANTKIERAAVPSNLIGSLPKESIVSVTVKCGDVGANAFKGFSAIKSVQTNEVRLIGYYAFQNCATLERVVFGEKLEEIMDYSFQGCTSLRSVVFPNGVTRISGYAFADCAGLSRIEIGKNVTAIGMSAFANCASLESVVIPEGVTSLSSTFSGCTALKSVTLPEGLQTISSAFRNCVSLESIALPSTLTAFDGFSGCAALKSIVVPDGVTSVTRGALAGCAALEALTVPFVGRSVKNATEYSQYPFGWIFGTGAYDGGVATVQKYINFNLGVADSETTYYIPSSLKKVTVTGGNLLCGAFSNCANLTSVTIGSGVSRIESEAFTGCTALAEVKFLNTEGWTVAQASDGEGTQIDVLTPSTNAVYLTDTYLAYYWRRRV